MPRAARASPALRVLATSREPLGVDGEELLVLGPLALPASGDRADVEAAPATRLFEERARSAGARAAASAAELAALAELCRRLDGVPLAIELAAARARSLTARELLAQLDRRFDLLQRAEPVGRARHAEPARGDRRLLRAARPEERAFFRALGVFAGPFGAELAHAVAAPAGVDRLATLDVLSRLVDRSLVSAEPRARRHAVPPARLAPPLRGRAARAAGEWDALVDRFVDAMVAEADRIVAPARAAGRAEVLDTLFAQLANLVAAIDRCIASDADAARAFRLAAAALGRDPPGPRGRGGRGLRARPRALAGGRRAAARRGAAPSRRARRCRRAGSSARRSSPRACSATPGDARSRA